MKIIISPSKTQSFTKEKNQIEVLLKKETVRLYEIIKKLSQEKFKKIFKIKGKLLEDTLFNYNLKDADKPVGKVIESYTGVVFEQLELDSYNKDQLDYLNKNLRILSAMYGVLSPSDYIYPYRLDMTVKLPKINLYSYWQKTIDEYYIDEDIVVNLASLEFSKMLKNYSGRFVDIEFYEETRENQLKVVSYNAKKCRGQMLNFLIKNQVEDISKIKEFVFEGYIFSENLSNKDKFIFVRKIDW